MDVHEASNHYGQSNSICIASFAIKGLFCSQNTAQRRVLPFARILYVKTYELMKSTIY